MKEVVKKDILKYFDNGIVYPFSDSSWASFVLVVPKKSKITMIQNNDNELIPTRVHVLTTEN